MLENIQSETQQNKNSQQGNQNSVDKEQNIKELLFSGGGGALAFLAGYIHGMIAIVGKEKLKEYKLGGVSAGASLSFFLHVVLHQDEYDMKYFYQKWMRKLYEKENRKYYGFLTSGQCVRAFLGFYQKIVREKNIKSVNDQVHVAITTFNKFGLPKSELISNFESEQDLQDCIIASCGIPYLLDPQFFAYFRGKKTMDGGFTRIIPNRFEDSYKIFINILPKASCQFPFVWNTPKNLEIIHACESDKKLVFPKDFFMWDENWADEMFMSGILAAKSDSDKLIKLFK